MVLNEYWSKLSGLRRNYQRWLKGLGFCRNFETKHNFIVKSISNAGHILLTFSRILPLTIGNNNEIKEWNISEVGENILKNSPTWKVSLTAALYSGCDLSPTPSVVRSVGDLYCAELCYRYRSAAWCFDGWYDGYRH